MFRNDESPKAVGKRLKILRTISGLSRSEVCKRANVGIASMSNWEHGNGNAMLPRSLQKIISLMQAEGIICSEEWVKTGIGNPPLTQADIDAAPVNITSNNEIELFKHSQKNALIIEIEHNALLPFLRKGDMVGGVVLSLSNFTRPIVDGLYIIKMDNQLDVRRVRKGAQADCFMLSYFSYDPQWLKLPEFYEVKLEAIAPILRVWHQ